MAVPVPTFGDNGFIIPSDADILAAVKAYINAAFGGGLNMADETPQGQLAVSMTAAISNAYQLFQQYTQQTDPAYSSGRMQDGIARIYFIERLPALPTTVTGTCTGAQGVVIPAGSRAQDVAGNIYISLADATIPASGTVDVTFQNIAVGAIPCPAGTMTIIFTVIPGWDSVTNVADGALGRAVESRAQFELRRYLSVAKNSAGAIPSVRGSVLGVDGVLDAYVTENVTSAPVTIGGVTIGPKTLYAAVVGGADADVARAIWTKKAPGCGYTGNTNVTVYDNNSGYRPPYPAYSVTFERPSGLAIYFKVTLANNPLIPADALTLIQNAIINAFAGGDGGLRASIGAEMLASRFYLPVALLGSWAQVVNIKIGSMNNTAADFTASIAAAVMTVSAVSAGALAAGQTIAGAGVTEGTTIVNQISGPAGGAGTYTVSAAQTVGSTTMSSCNVDLDSFTPNINQEPVTAPGDIYLALV